VQRDLAETFADRGARKPMAERPKLQAGFCIDVRSEVFRRALESVDPAIQTIGFAGFFGLTASHKGFASDVVEHRPAGPAEPRGAPRPPKATTPRPT
jgi:uncharacterized protein YbcC (UPF0753/DUF2309 family)